MDIEQARELADAVLNIGLLYEAGCAIDNALAKAEELANGIVAALSQKSAVPEGFVLVPVEPTTEMLEQVDADPSDVRTEYIAMLAARPEVQP